MKNNNSENFLIKKTLKGFTVRICVWTVSIPLVFFIIYTVINRLDFQWLYDDSPEVYYQAIRFFDTVFNPLCFTIIVFFIWFIGFSILLYQLITKVFSYVDAISIASQNLLDKNIEYIELPAELDSLQRKMNYLKRKSEKNELAARQSEQKKNDLIVYLAHDLKTPLTSMIGYLSLLDEIKNLPQQQQEKYIQVALEKSYQLEDLIDELFDIARFNSQAILLDKKEINLNLMLEQISDDFYPILIEKHREIQLKSNSHITIYGDPDKLARVFGNLIKNAIYYSTDRLITVNSIIKGGFVEITTSNRGEKIPEESLNRLFEKFYRTDSSRTSSTGGSGLGLAIAKEIVELHGGTICADSNEDFTQFTVKLPVRQNAV